VCAAIRSASVRVIGSNRERAVERVGMVIPGETNGAN
jgi:hypothetical protein